jgi:3-deoxy-7-phosphoheptulonate synthase
MLVRLKRTATVAQVAEVKELLACHGVGARAIDQVIVVVSGDAVAANFVGNHPAVESVESLTTPYRLAARAVRPQGTMVRAGNVTIGGSSFSVAAGPCAVESRHQVHETAASVARSGARLLRGGAFKPRTSPYSFQGLGEEGLELLAEAGRAVGLPTVTEVVAAEDVRLVAAYADVLQVGARNTQNFALLKALGSAGKPVLLKRGMASTIEELLMSAEYIMAHGNPDVILCERGVRTFETSTRNTLDLNAVALLKRLTHLPVFVDPSHGTGRRELVAPMSKAALAVGADGLIVEVHPRPEAALSDGPQSLRLEDFGALMHELAPMLPLAGRQGWTADLPQASDLAGYRERIDAIDEALVQLLNERAELALRIGRIKIANGRPIRSRRREHDVIRHVSSATSGPLDATAVARLFRAIIDETRNAEEQHVA